MYAHNAYNPTVTNDKSIDSSIVLTWLNTTATISHVLNFDMATIQGWPLIEGDVYCTEAPSMWLLFSTLDQRLILH